MKEYRQADEAHATVAAEVRRLQAVQAKLRDLHTKLSGESSMSQFAASQIWRQLQPYMQEIEA